MAEAASEIDPQVVEDLRRVEQGCQILGACNVRAEFWEGFTLLKTGRDAFQAEIERLDGERRKGAETKLATELAQKLEKYADKDASATETIVREAPAVAAPAYRYTTRSAST